uniref:Thioredoxin n=1 Tax=Caldiarchaeum subterraneum TaxID=311458 RepID=A0A7C5U3V3_CALS0
MSEPVEVTDLDFDEFISKHRFVVVDFWAEWCAPCRAIAPVVKELAKQYAGKVVFGKLNVDENPRTASRFGIMGIPTLLFFKSGKVVDMVVGAVPKRTLEARIAHYI